MSGRVLALVESNTSGTGRLFVRRARDLGLRPVLLTEDPSRYRFGGDEPEILRAPTGDVAEVAAACRGLAGTAGPLAGVGTSSDYYVEVAAAVAARLGLPGGDAAAIEATRDKERQRNRLRDGGVPVPRFAAVSTADEAAAAVAGIGTPVVVKPVTGSGSRGVRLCVSAEEAVRYADKLLGVTADERGRPVPRRVLVERYVPGEEYSVEVFGELAVGVTRKHLGSPPTFVEVGHDHPADLAREDEEALCAAALAAVSRLGLSFGPAHAELRLGADGPVIIEVNPRLAGGWIPRLVHEATGVDLVMETVRAFAGRPPRRSPRPPAVARASSIRFLLPDREGDLVAVHGTDRAAAVPGVVETEIYKEPGSVVRLEGDFRDRIGHVITRTGTASSAAAAAEEALARLAPEIRTGP
ncbi:ATP-grasp domain-containing protein [Sphaerisporangium sp. B11E5]|uniref:ATP-grasp domain-containing protein n=1 Tax=Sphaerisporangium sp. B11E5 TaxID=3153563 RepID=UPI00325D211A